MADLKIPSNIFQNIGIPYNYTVGGPTSPSTVNGIPVNVRLSLDPQFQKTVMNVATILGATVGGGILVSALFSKRK